jgi:nickel transport system permease protein
MVNLAQKLQPPSATYPFGTDHLGRCILSRVLYGARISLGYAALICLSALGIGLIIGILAGYLGGWVDHLLMRIADGLIAIPSLLFVIGFVGIWGADLKQVVLGLILVQWVFYARVIRGMVMSLKEQQYIIAARISGSSSWRVIKKHIAPNVISSLAVMGTLEMGWAIMNLSSMSFLGLGIQPPAPEWGAMILEGKSYIRTNPALMLYPGLCIMVVVIVFNLLGECLSERFGIKRR